MSDTQDVSERFMPILVTEQDPEPTPSTRQAPQSDYVVNKNTGKFHYPSCNSVKQMSEKNKWYYTGTRDDLIYQGYEPCKWRFSPGANSSVEAKNAIGRFSPIRAHTN